MYNNKQDAGLHNSLLLHSKIVVYISALCFPNYHKFVQVPDNFIRHALNGNLLVDVNNCVLINTLYHKAILNGAQFVQLKFENMTTRLVQAVPTDLMYWDSCHVLVSCTLEHNLLNKSVGGTCQILPVDAMCIQVATDIHLSNIAGQEAIGASIVDILLKRYFQSVKLLYKNDIITINVKQYAPEFYYAHVSGNDIDDVYFKCQQISIAGLDDCTGGGYFCVVGKSTLSQNADVPSKLPRVCKMFKRPTLPAHCKEDRVALYDGFIMDSCPYGLESYLKQLESAARPFLTSVKLKLNPIFLLAGPKGAGKGQILASLSQRLGINVCQVGSADFSAQTYAQTEIKIRNAFFRAKLCAPSMLIVNNFEELCRNHEGHYDARIQNHLKNELDVLFSTTDAAILVVCVTTTTELPSDQSRLFLATIKLTAPNQEERQQLIAWILAKHSLTSNHVAQIASRTHGFLFEDLVVLIQYALVAGRGRSRPITGEQMESALERMQTDYTESVGAPRVPKVQWSDIGGANAAKNEIMKTLKHPGLFKTAGLKRAGLLLYGPPGTGKTLLAKAVATECGQCFLSIKGPELLNMYVGQSEQNVREVFERARAAAPCIIFFDELDSLAPNRGVAGDSGGVMDRVVSQLLSEMDGLDENAAVLVIGATNRPDLIDPALLRPGRFDKLLYVGPCTDTASKLAVLQALTRKFRFSDKLSLQRVVERWCPANLTGADFYGICSRAWMSAASRVIRRAEKETPAKKEKATHADVVVTLKDFEEAVKSAKPSVSSSDLAYFDNLRQELSTE